MSKYLITGGAGFIGSNIAKELLARGEKVRILDNFSTGKRENVEGFKNNPNFELVEGDLRDLETVKKACEGVDFILHQGALPSVPRSIKDPMGVNEVNTLGTLNILEAAKEFGIKRVVFASSSSIYGNDPTLPKHEEMSVSPLSPYALTKYAGERYCQLYHQLYGLETVALRYFNVFGPNQDPSSEYSAVIPKFIKLISENKRPTIYGDGTNSRDFTFVANNVAANIAACTAEKASGQVMNIACGERYTLLDLIKAINEILGKNIEPEFQPERTGEVKHSMADISRAQEILDFAVKTKFKEGLEETIKSMGLK
ncbi:MAG: SDR family oxidoreductase [Patescibacteria group bacterium]